MSEFKGTPGPWFIRYCDDAYHQSMTVITSDPKWNGKPNFGLFNNEPDTVSIVYHQLSPYVGADKNPAVTDANARLIAAAPELLDALKKTGLQYKNPPTFHEQRSLSERLYRAQVIL